MQLFKDVCVIIDPFIMSEKPNYKDIIGSEYILLLSDYTEYNHPLVKKTYNYSDRFIYINDGTYIDNTYVIKVTNNIEVKTEYIYYYILYFELRNQIYKYQFGCNEITNCEIKIPSIEKQNLIINFVKNTEAFDEAIYNEQFIYTTFNMMKQVINSYIKSDTTYSKLERISRPFEGQEYDKDDLIDGKYKIITTSGESGKHKAYNRTGFNIVVCSFYNDNKYEDIGSISNHILIMHKPFFVSNTGFTLNIINKHILAEFLGLYLYFFNQEIDYDSNFGWRDIKDLDIPMFSKEIQIKLIKILYRKYELLKNIRPGNLLIKDYFDNIL